MVTGFSGYAAKVVWGVENPLPIIVARDKTKIGMPFFMVLLLSMTWRCSEEMGLKVRGNTIGKKGEIVNLDPQRDISLRADPRGRP